MFSRTDVSLTYVAVVTTRQYSKWNISIFQAVARISAAAHPLQEDIFRPFMTIFTVLSPESVTSFFLVSYFLFQVMESLGILEELREAGATDGDMILVGETEIALAEPPENLGS